jgi:hypothetical protein
MATSQHDVCFTPKSGHWTLFDHLVGRGEQRLRNGQAEWLRGLEIDNQLEFGRRLHRHVGWLLALKDTIDIPRGSSDGAMRIGPVRN